MNIRTGGMKEMFISEMVRLSIVERDLVVEVAKAMVPFEEKIAVRWHDMYSASRMVHQSKNRAVRSFHHAVQMLLTSLADADFDGYLERIQETGATFARAKEKYENLIVFFYFYEASIMPFLQQAFPEKIDQVQRALEHLYHGIVAIMSRAYFIELEKDHEKFLSTLVHDLRNPLVGITGFARLMVEKSMPMEKVTKLLRIIRDSGDKMSSLINHALTYGRLKSGKALPTLSEVDVVEIVREAATVLIPEIEKRSLAVSINEEQLKNWDSIPQVTALADRELLLRAMGNYMSNAVKYAKTRVAVTVQKTGEDVLIVVRDDGPGIPPDKLSHIFESYYVVPGGKPGIGIGLASVRMIADLHKGKVWVESDQAKGSAFSFLLPGRRSGVKR